jgi:hypothetical protein
LTFALNHVSLAPALPTPAACNTQPFGRSLILIAGLAVGQVAVGLVAEHRAGQLRQDVLEFRVLLW